MEPLSTEPISAAKQETGQALVYVTLAMIVILAMVSLAVDVGLTYAERRRMQNAADAGALAGAEVMCMGTPVAVASARAYTYAHDLNSAPTVQVTIDPNQGMVTVKTSKTARLTFGQVVGFSNPRVPAVAGAQCTSASSASGVFPVAFSRAIWNYLYSNGAGCGRYFYVWAGSNDNTGSPDCVNTCNCDVDNDGRDDLVTDVNRAWIDFSSVATNLYPDGCIQSGCGANELGCLVRNNTGVLIHTPSCIPGDSGKKAGLQNDITAVAGRPEIVPLFSSLGCTPNGNPCGNQQTYDITAFGCIRLATSPWQSKSNFKLSFHGTPNPPANGNANICWSDAVIKVKIECTVGACYSGSGHGGGAGPTPGSPSSVSLVK
jgi:hypothetical protein